MNKFKGYMLVSDFDGTLINKNGQISNENIEAINYFVKNGGMFCGATGRTHLNVAPYKKLLPVQSPWILFNGGGVYDFEHERFLHEELINAEDLKPLVAKVVEAIPHINVQVCTSKTLYLVNPNALPDVMVVEEGQEHENVMIDDIKLPWIKLMFQGRAGDLRKAEEIISTDLNLETYRYFYSGVAYLEIMSKSVSKGSGLHVLKGILKNDIHHFCAIGDYYNDVEMLIEADVSAAPDNAPEDIKAYASVVVKDHDEHAVKDFIEWIEGHIVKTDELTKKSAGDTL